MCQHLENREDTLNAILLECISCDAGACDRKEMFIRISISLMANSLNFNSVYFYIFENLSMIALNTHKNFAIILNSVNLTISGQVA